MLFIESSFLFYNLFLGKPTKDTKTFVKLNFHKNADGEYHCPALFKPFTKNSHIVAVAGSGNVFCWEAIEQLNIKPKNWKDLVDDTPFQRKDLIVIQDPQKLEKFDISRFYHIKKNLRVLTEEEIAEQKDPKNRIKSMNHETRETLADLEKVYKAPEEGETSEKLLADKFNAAHYSTGAVAASFTSTAMVPVSKVEAAVISDDLIKYERVKKKGYVRILTNFGPLNCEVFCDSVPKTSDNFITHSSKGYYDNVKFHRSIRNFMVSVLQRMFRMVSKCFFGRFKEEIRQGKVTVANLFGIKNLKMNSDLTLLTAEEVFCLWLIAGLIQTDHNCELSFCNH